MSELERHVRVFGALADPLRLGLVTELRNKGRSCGGDLAENAGISLALFCHHARILVDSGVLIKTKNGQTTYYTVDESVLGNTSNLLSAPAIHSAHPAAS